MMAATKSPTGSDRQKPARRLSRSMSSIMTTNRNSTITAPTYTSTSTIARNSAFISSQMAADDTKVSTRNSAL